VGPVLEAAGAAHPGQRPDGAHPVGDGRDEAEILLDMLFANPAGRDHAPVDKLIAGPKTLSSIIWTGSAIKWGQA
jgi:hypothetical protein